MPEPEIIDFANPSMLAPGVQGYSMDTDRGLFIPMIRATDEGDGAVGEFLDTLPTDRRVVFSIVISGRLRGMLLRRGFVDWFESDDMVGSYEVMVREAEGKMGDGTKCWLVGQGTGKDGELLGVFTVVEAERVGDITDGRQTVNTRPNCRSGILVTLPSSKVYDTKEAAEARMSQFEAEEREK